MRIVFFGTPDFAVASLQALVDNAMNVCAVVTAPDKPAGRGLKMQMSAVKQYALTKQIPVLQPEKLKDENFLTALRAFKADVQVVVAFRMLPEVVWNMPPLGSINVHASLLPQFRGAAPINWAIIRGAQLTGVTTFRLQHAIDTGNIFMQKTVAIDSDETAGTLHDKLMHAGAALIVETLRGIDNNSISERPQQNDEEVLMPAPKIFTESCRINWQQGVQQVYDHIRGLSPYPTAFTELNGKKIKIFSARPEWQKHTQQPGEILTDQKNYLKFACTDGYLSITDLQLEGKSRMRVADFLRGYRVS